jgi:hypothetical protein
MAATWEPDSDTSVRARRHPILAGFVSLVAIGLMVLLFAAAVRDADHVRFGGCPPGVSMPYTHGAGVSCSIPGPGH